MGAVRLVPDGGKPAGAVARVLDLTESALRSCVSRAQADHTKGKSGGLMTLEREEPARLHKENRQLRLERDGPRKHGKFSVQGRRAGDIQRSAG